MEYLYGTFSDRQIQENAKMMHSDIHKLLLYKDPKIDKTVNPIFETEDAYNKYFLNLLLRYGGLNSLLKEPTCMILLMSTLQAAFLETQSEDFDFKLFRKLILNAHGYITSLFEEVR